MITAIQIELDLLCLVMLYAIAHQSLANVNQQMNRVLFRTLVYGVMTQLTLDVLWLLEEGRIFPGATMANRIINALYLAGGVILGCIWYLYVLETLGYTITRRLQTIVMLPGLFFLIFNFIKKQETICVVISIIPFDCNQFTFTVKQSRAFQI